jgi:hypothetical protein
MIKVGRGALRAFDRTVWRKPLARFVGNYLCVFNGVSWVGKNEKHRLRGKTPIENCDLGSLMSQNKSSTVEVLTFQRYGHTPSN